MPSIRINNNWSYQKKQLSSYGPLRWLVSWGSLGEYFMVDCSLNYRSLKVWCRFLTWGVFESNIAHRRSVAVLCMLYKIMCNPMHPFHGTLHVPHVPVRVARGALDPLRHNYESLCRRTSQHSRTFIPISVSLWTILMTQYSMMSDWRVLRAKPMFFHWPKLLVPLLSPTVFLFHFFIFMGWYCGVGVSGLIGCSSLSLHLALQTFFNGNWTYNTISTSSLDVRYSIARSLEVRHSIDFSLDVR